MVRFGKSDSIEEPGVVHRGETGQLPKTRKNESVIARLRHRLHQKLLSTFRLSSKSKEPQPTRTPSPISEVLFPPAVPSPIGKPSNIATRMYSLRSILELSILRTPVSRLITPPPSTSDDPPPADGPEIPESTSSAESIASWDRGITRNHEQDASSMSICSEDSIAESSSLSGCSYRLDNTIPLCRVMSAPVLNCFDENTVYVDEDLRQKRICHSC
ncbi:hypothetical protein COOONC_13439 [Cooperia oncophora]